MSSIIQWGYYNGQQLVGVVMDPIWWADNFGSVDDWLRAHGGNAGGGMVWVPDEETKTLFTLRWL